MTTSQSDVVNDPKYIPVLDSGFVGLVDHMGDDEAIVRAARVSYGKGTRKSNEDRGLIRYLMRKRHTSPFEMCEIKLHIKAPIFVFRQLVRHRTASLNEYSGRYSVMSDEFYMPSFDSLKPQSQTNKQGREGELSDKAKCGIQWLLDAHYDNSYKVYEALIKSASEYADYAERRRDVIYDMYEPGDGWFEEDYPGLARELARIALPVANYSELYWKQDLHNLLHLMKLRRDGDHAQAEIVDYAEAIYQICKPLFPLTIEAWEDYIWHAQTFSRMEVELLKEMLAACRGEPVFFLQDAIKSAGSEKAFAEKMGMTARELTEFRAKLDM